MEKLCGYSGHLNSDENRTPAAHCWVLRGRE
jgi:hypothetical protein